ncbi:MAG: metal-dependent hydrolase, partial [Cytophaga sp.]|nr:metal-dependent hydrolase [Cytophaga sp.]
TVDDRDSTLVFNDLRFGQIMGWDHPEGKFVFRYYLQKPDENLLVMQRGRFTGWNRKTVRAMLTRIKGI